MPSPRTLDEENDTRALDRWVAHGLITADQAARIRAFESGPAAPDGPPPAGPSVVIEALGYLGGALVAAAGILLGARWWDDLPLLGRVGLLGAVSVVLVVAGAAVPRTLGPTAQRLRSVLWVVSTGTFAATCGVLAEDGFDWTAANVATEAGAAAALWALALWRRNRDVLPLLAVLVGTAVAAGAAASHRDDDLAPGLAVWAVAVVWAALGWGGLLPPRPVVLTSGALAALVGAMLTTSHDAGIVLALATTAAVVAVGVGLRDLALLGVGTAGAFVTVPRAVSRWFPGSASAALVLLALGLVLVLAAVRTAKRPDADRGRPGR
jgi:hypothetical protein